MPEDSSLPVPETQQQAPVKQPPHHGKPPKTQLTSVERNAEPSTQASTPSQTPKSESPTPRVQSQTIPQQADPAPEQNRESKDSYKEDPLEEHVNNIDDSTKVANHEENHIGDKPKSSSLLKYPYKEGRLFFPFTKGNIQSTSFTVFAYSTNPIMKAISGFYLHIYYSHWVLGSVEKDFDQCGHCRSTFVINWRTGFYVGHWCLLVCCHYLVFIVFMHKNQNVFS